MSKVIIERRDVYSYPHIAPFRPSLHYPESFCDELNPEDNPVYDMVRECFIRAGYDKENYGTEKWNPLGHLIKKGDSVLIKPNLVMDINPNGEGEECLYTQPSVVAAVLDYVYLALNGEGKITVGDAPMQECDFDNLLKKSGYNELAAWCISNYKGVSFELVDFRGIKSKVVDGIHHYFEGEQSGVVVHLDYDSEFVGIDDYKKENIRITNYDPNLLKQHHQGEKHEYFISRYVLQADVIINMPKPKTHRKAGVTIAMKNLVGINTRKEYLPHHTNGSIKEGGDEYLNKSIIKRIRSLFLDKANKAAQTKKNFASAKIWNSLVYVSSCFARIFQKDKYSEGSWYGNNTISKTILDLNKILFFADKSGQMREAMQRKYLIVADMVVSGEKDGPVHPSPKDVGIIAIGENPVSFDKVIATLMGAKIDQIPTLNQMKQATKKYCAFAEDNEEIFSNDPILNNSNLATITDESILFFTPTSGWKEVFRHC